MREPEFTDWLPGLDRMQERTAEIRITNAKTVESDFGSLDDHYSDDGGRKLLELFTYSPRDRDQNAPTKHGLSFTGDVYSKTANLKHSIKRYMKLRNFE